MKIIVYYNNMIVCWFFCNFYIEIYIFILFILLKCCFLCYIGVNIFFIFIEEMIKYYVVLGINGMRCLDSVIVCIKDWKYLI